MSIVEVTNVMGRLKMKKLSNIFLPIILWMAMIFIFSDQPYDRQNIKPELEIVIDHFKEDVHPTVLSFLLSKITISYAGKEINVNTVSEAGLIEFLIRKFSHFFAFFVLGLLIYRGFVLFFHSRKLTYFMVSFIIVSIYAATDEYHQMYTENRTPLVQDVFLDMAGGLAGIFFALFFYKKRAEVKNKVTLSSK